MLSGATLSAAATVGTAVFRMVVSSASMKKATATSHGTSRLTESSGEGGGGIGLMSVGRAMRARVRLVWAAQRGLSVELKPQEAAGQRRQRECVSHALSLSSPRGRKRRGAAVSLPAGGAREP